MKSNLLDFSKHETQNSKFEAQLEPRGGNITFSNSGKGGDKKYFSLSLETFLTCLKDIKKNISTFQGHESYIEKEWRNLGSNHYTDKPANAQSTVQTKPMFATLSKIIMWANSPNLDNIDPEQQINLELSKIEQAIVLLNELTEKFKPYEPTQKINEQKILSSNSIRDFAFLVFDFFYKDNWEAVLNDSKIKNGTINEVTYQIYDHKWFKNLLGVFDKPQNKESLSSSNTIRYFEKPIYINEGKKYYFTTQWNATGEYHLSFKNLKNFIETKFKNHKLIQEDKTFTLYSVEKNKAKIPQIKFNSKSFYKYCQYSGLTYSEQLITRYISSLATKPFVLLSGLSGSGKTKLAQAYAQWICEDKTQYCIVPVGADWTNREPLLGYVNALANTEYILPENGALQLLIEANKEENQTKPYFLILDEMNLSHVERYFADFLSVMESKDNFKLHNGSCINLPESVGWPKNLFVVGTVNIDETTYMFSPKVLDRANAIEFRVSKTEIEKFLDTPNEVDLMQLEFKGANMATSFIEIAKNKEFETIDTASLNKTLVNFFAELKKTGAEFGYRTGMEIHRLYQQLSIINKKVSENDKIDIAVMQKLLPKLHGSRRKLCPVLEILAKLCVQEGDAKKDFLENKEELVFKENANVIYPLSLEKITRMYKGAIDNGFASYAEA